MNLARNMTAAMANAVVVVLINLLALPFYLRFLGMEAYGLIGFYVTLQAVMQILDMGLGPTISREVAQGAETGQQRRSASLLRTLGLVYLGFAIVIFGLVVLAAPRIAAHWLQADQLSESTVVQAVTLMGLNLACRWPIGLYHGALCGAHRLARSSLTSIAVNISAAITSVAMLAWVEGTIQVFFMVQAVFGLLHSMALRILAWRALNEMDAPYDFGDLLRVWTFSAWMGGVAIAGLLLSQIDKLVLSRILGLEEFGHYMLATLLASGMGILTVPVYSAIYPKFSSLIARGDLATLEQLYAMVTRLFTVALFALASLLMFQSEPLITLWLRDVTITAEVAPITALLALGTAINGVMFLPYALQLAAGHSRLAFLIAAILLCLMLPLTLALAVRHGPAGGASAWMLLNVVYAILGSWATGRAVMPFAGWRWLVTQVALPAIITVIPALIGAWICRTVEAEPWSAITIGGLAALAGAALGVTATFSAADLKRFFDTASGRSVTE